MQEVYNSQKTYQVQAIASKILQKREGGFFVKDVPLAAYIHSCVHAIYHSIAINWLCSICRIILLAELPCLIQKYTDHKDSGAIAKAVAAPLLSVAQRNRCWWSMHEPYILYSAKKTQAAPVKRDVCLLVDLLFLFHSKRSSEAFTSSWTAVAHAWATVPGPLSFP
jgi:hypothetical protein